jgi:SAM-dependent methyltransferase
MHENSRLIFNAYARQHFGPGQRVLEIGPDGFPSTYQKQVGDLPNLVWDTLDLIPSDKLTYPNSDPYHFPVADKFYDVVLAGQVIEHVPKVWIWVHELERVCRPGGTVVIIGPVSWPYHEAPVDCWRIYPEGMRALLEDTDLQIEKCTFRSFGTLDGSGGMQPARIFASPPGWAVRLIRLSLPTSVRQWAYHKVGRMQRLAATEHVFDTITIAKRRSPGQPEADADVSARLG